MEVFTDLLDTIDLHHGSLSQDPPYDRIEVYGARPNQAVMTALEAIGFAVRAPTADGFTAERVANA